MPKWTQKCADVQSTHQVAECTERLVARGGACCGRSQDALARGVLQQRGVVGGDGDRHQRKRDRGRAERAVGTDREREPRSPRPPQASPAREARPACRGGALLGEGAASPVGGGHSSISGKSARECVSWRSKLERPTKRIRRVRKKRRRARRQERPS